MFTGLIDKLGSNSEAVTSSLLSSTGSATMVLSVFFASVWVVTIKSNYNYESFVSPNVIDIFTYFEFDAFWRVRAKSIHFVVNCQIL